MAYDDFCHRLYKSEATAASAYDVAAIYTFGKGAAVNFPESLLQESPKRLVDLPVGSTSGVVGFAPSSSYKEERYLTQKTKPAANSPKTLSNDSKSKKKGRTSGYRGVVYNSEFNAWQISTTSLGY